MSVALSSLRSSKGVTFREGSGDHKSATKNCNKPTTKEKSGKGKNFLFIDPRETQKRKRVSRNVPRLQKFCKKKKKKENVGEMIRVKMKMREDEE